MDKKLGRRISSTSLAFDPVVTAAGALFYAVDTRRCLYLLRSHKQRGTWGLVGGKQNAGESVQDTLYREFNEEIGGVPGPHRLIPLETFTSDDLYFKFVTFACIVPAEFTPVLNSEHYGYCWVQMGEFPRPLHPGLRNTLNFRVIQNKIETICSVTWSF
jgi:8-oxo-dGTP pyrophosphatase MutT (NUDIX family)